MRNENDDDGCIFISYHLYRYMYSSPNLHCVMNGAAYLSFSRSSVDLILIYKLDCWEGRSGIVCLLCASIKWQKWRRSLVRHLARIVCEDNHHKKMWFPYFILYSINLCVLNLGVRVHISPSVYLKF